MIELCTRDYPNVFYFVVIKTSVRAEMLELVKCWSPQRKKCIFFYVSHSHCGTTGDSVAGHGMARVIRVRRNTQYKTVTCQHLLFVTSWHLNKLFLPEIGSLAVLAPLSTTTIKDFHRVVWISKILKTENCWPQENCAMDCRPWHKNYRRWWVGRQAGAVAEVAITDAGLNSNKFWTGFYIYTLIFIF